MINQLEGREQARVRVRVRRRKRKSKKPHIIMLVILFICLGASAVGAVVSSIRYSSDLSIAQAGLEHLQKAEALFVASPQNLLDAHAVDQAQQEFASAVNSFVQLNDDLKLLPGFTTLTPAYSPRLNAARHLVPLAIALSQAGVTGCDILKLLTARLHDPLSSQTGGITLSGLSSIANDVQQIQSEMAIAISEAGQLQPSDVQFDARISKFIDMFHSQGAVLQGLFNDIENLLPVAPTLLGIGTSANYLIEILDSTELRPGGGFIGNYGIATLSGGRLLNAHITDTDLLDAQFEATGRVIPLPPTYGWFDIAPPSWELRDANLDADFPTSARNAEYLYAQEGGNVPVQGVIAITPALIQQALGITGPIVVPEYKETVTAQNLVDRIHYYQLGPGAGGSDHIASPDGHSSLRKRFTELLAEHFLARVRQLAASDSSKLWQVMLNGIRSKDLQVYFNANEAEVLLQHAHLDAAIQPTFGDDLFIVDANIGANKANDAIINTMADKVTVDVKGNAIHHLTLTYAWTLPIQKYGNDTYRDYVRLYAPNGSVLQTQDGWQYRGTSSAFGHEVWSGFFTLTYGQTSTITLTWSTPQVARQDAHGWHYQDTIQRQAGTRWVVHEQIDLPSCAVLTNVSGGLKVTDKQTAMLSQFLTANTMVGIDYLC
jgi:hypothetical protein